MSMHPIRDASFSWGCVIRTSSLIKITVRFRYPCYLYRVNRRITIFFIILFTLAQTELHQLLKLPVLVEHFREHRQLDPSVSFFSYLKEHYHEHTVIDNDYQRDMQLPFKTADCLTALSFLFEAPPSFEVERVMCVIRKEYNIHPEYFPVRQSLDNIFQPPRFT